jgi:UPF0755 protein
MTVQKKRAAWAIVVGGVALLAAVVIAGAWLVRELARDPIDYQSVSGVGEVSIVVEPGQDLTQVGRELVANDVVLTVEGFIKASLRNPDSTSVTPGTYALPKQISSDRAIELLLDPASKRFDRVVIPEGLRVSEILRRLSEQTDVPRADFDNALKTPGALGLPEWAQGNPEGFLFPATYTFDPGTSAEEILQTMIKRFNQAAEDVNLIARAKQRGYTPYQILTIASLLEGEGQPEHFGKVARVIENRFELGMPLQFDSTVNYGLGTTDISLTESQLKTDSPYNSYLYRGLPPTPISSPGEAALRAALEPTPGKWLYFVTIDPDTGETRFSESYQEFLRNKAIFTQWLKDNN